MLRHYLIRPTLLIKIGTEHLPEVFYKHHIYCFGQLRWYSKKISKTESEEEYRQPCQQFTTIGKLFNCFAKKTYASNNKVSVIGMDEVGTATVFALLTKNVTNNVCMIDLNEDVLKGEEMDFQFGSMFLNNAKITSSRDPVATSNSKICVVTTGTYRGKEEQEEDYITRNSGIMRALIPPLAKYSPDTIFIVASDPVDILSYLTWKLSGVAKSRVLGIGTLLDTASFRYLLAEKLGVSPASCHAYIIGERGENSVPVWSSVNVAGVCLRDYNPKIGTDTDPENWQDLHKEVVKSDDTVKQLKGGSSWAISLAIADLCHTIFNNSNIVRPISTHVKGEHGIREDVFLSLPCVVGQSGVSDIIRQPLTDTEGQLLRRSADNIARLQDVANKMLL